MMDEKKIKRGEKDIHDMIDHIEKAIGVASYLKDTGMMVGTVYWSEDTAFGYRRVWNSLKKTLESLEDQLYVFLADYKDVVDQMQPPPDEI